MIQKTKTSSLNTMAIRFKPYIRWCLLPLIAALLQQQSAYAQVAPPDQELLRQQERERALREQLERGTDTRLQEVPGKIPSLLPHDETPCFPIQKIFLEGDKAARFQWALTAANPPHDPAIGRCLGTAGINIVISRVQNAIISRGYVTTRVLATPQDLKSGELHLTLIPGILAHIRFAPGTKPDATFWNAIPAHPGDLLNLRDIEQGLENFKRVPTVEADIQIVPTEGDNSQPGQSDLLISWTQGRPVRFNASFDDSGSKSTGKTQAGVTLSLDHALTQNDLFYISLNRSAFNGSKRGTRGITLHYSMPLGNWLIAATHSGYNYHQSIAGSQQTYIYSGESHNSELKLSRRLIRTASSKSGIYLRGWTRDSKNFIDDTEVLVQRRRMAGWEMGLTYRRYINTATLDTTLGFRRGTGAFGALPAPEELFDEGTSRPKIYFADLQFNLPFQLGHQSLRYTGSWRAQWNRTPLITQDRFSIGGRYTVRGFDGETTLIGERGWLLRNDLGLSLGGGQEAYLALDYAHIGGASAYLQQGNHLAGTALGLRGGHRSLFWDVFVGAPINRPRTFSNAYTVTGFSLNWSF
ncbi:ShlB/FhaC/HecB family hemolysin secretion/activation protein [Xylella fastidiosa]|uniref:ShlB/FhaC/HecB family hemolysin secretion/activation protein n=1 Tax=Xylella fastidiosa TaxID=2371 RepID=UPI0003038031|nr:ShlB/FhaC/HecB family hemolysin secretion/activation protein [Xylella fastidiosa]